MATTFDSPCFLGAFGALTTQGFVLNRLSGLTRDATDDEVKKVVNDVNRANAEAAETNKLLLAKNQAKREKILDLKKKIG